MWGNIRNALIFGLCIVFTVVECLVRPVEERTFEGDIDMSREEMNGMQMEILFTGKVHAVKVWPGGAIPYVISKKIGSISFSFLCSKTPLCETLTNRIYLMSDF